MSAAKPANRFYLHCQFQYAYGKLAMSHCIVKDTLYWTWVIVIQVCQWCQVVAMLTTVSTSAICGAVMWAIGVSSSWSFLGSQSRRTLLNSGLSYSSSPSILLYWGRCPASSAKCHVFLVIRTFCKLLMGHDVTVGSWCGCRVRMWLLTILLLQRMTVCWKNNAYKLQMQCTH